MRNHPVTVHGVAIESATQMVVDAPLGHPLQAQRAHVQRLQIRMITGGVGTPVAQQSLDARRVWKLGSGSESSPAAVEVLFELLPGLDNWSVIQARFRSSSLWLVYPLEDILDGLALLSEFIAILPVKPLDALQDVGKGRHAMSWFVRKIGAAKKRVVVVRGQKHGQWPATRALHEHLVRELVDLVEIGSFFPVHLDVDEQLVHHPGRIRILERLMGHDMAPVTGRIANGQENRLVLVTRLIQGFFAPRIPLHRVTRMLLEIRAGFVGKTIAHFGHPGSRGCQG